MDYDVILVDGNSIGYAAHSATKLHANGMETQAIFGMIKTIHDVKMRNPDARISVLWDGRSARRYALLPTYKEGREDTAAQVTMRDTYQEQKPYIHAMLSDLGVAQLHYADLEADDLAGYLTQSLKKRPGVSVLMLTGDGDWLQLVREGVTWHDKRSDLTIHAGNFASKTPYRTPYSLLEGKCLMGDTSDKIKGVGGIGAKGAPELLAEFGSVLNFWKQVDDGSFKPVYKAHQGLASAEGRVLFKRNLALMQLIAVPTPNPSQKIAWPCAYNFDSFRDTCHALGFLSILAKINDFVAPFAPKALEAA